MSLDNLFLLIKEELIVVGVATLPIFELRGSIPLGVSFGLSIYKVYFLSVLGNLIPVLPLLLFFKFFFHKLEKVKFVGKFFSWWFRRVEKKSESVKKWGFWGLVLLVAIPLPVTGAWTGTVAANLLEIKTKKAFLAILIGVLIAGLVVSSVVKGIISTHLFIRSL
ncbi:MAG: small multi-drug export protein [Candidatus Omnitrophica bacterium]|nr:small multi-drug export protein [Candidatus Omnitrophota bacterium]MCF7893605.1 small multi-drug export protein [Candidatus Omnitrophota bacterium]